MAKKKLDSPVERRSLTIKVSDSIGNVSALLYLPSDAEFILVFAHGAGAGMNNKFMEQTALTLASKNIASLRFNFPYMEKGKKVPDTKPVCSAAIKAAVEKASELFPDIPLFAGGKSFGGRMTSTAASEDFQNEVKGIVFFGFPLHAPGKPSIERAEHLKDVKSPMLFLQGSRDEFATWKLIEKVTSALPLAELIKIEGANHGFKAGKQDVIKLLTTVTKDWIEQKIG
jgi:hypothetical protein